ncbi:MAG: hypothetical protein Q8K82_14540 [Gemmatimonadaceae bacterium]|nr:hypothetical protein [Gemmatimonadaceae bacterium]
MKIPLTWRYLLAFYCLGALMGMSHELAHHAAGFAICGDWGYKTFNHFELAKGCTEAHPGSYWLATLVGPLLFNYLPLWIGFALMRKPDAGTRLFGVSLVFSTVPVLRLLSVLKWGDETVMVNHFFGDDVRALWIMKGCALALILPPVYLAWRTFSNRYKPLVFALFFIGVPLTVFFLVGIVLEDLIIKRHVLADTLWGMPYMVLLAEVLASIGYALLKSHLWIPVGNEPPSGALTRVAADTAATGQ